jgi:hypothetical protein
VLLSLDETELREYLGVAGPDIPVLLEAISTLVCAQ